MLAAVLAGHLLVLDWLASALQPVTADGQAPARWQVDFLRELMPSAPPRAPTAPGNASSPGPAASPTASPTDSPGGGRMQWVEVMVLPPPASAPVPRPAPARGTTVAEAAAAASAPVVSGKRASPRRRVAPKRVAAAALAQPRPPATAPVPTPVPTPAPAASTTAESSDLGVFSGSPSALAPQPPPAQASSPGSPGGPDVAVGHGGGGAEAGTGTATGTAAGTDPPADATRAAVPASAASAPRDTGQVSDAPAFDWPPSTQLRYTLVGHYRGPVEGSAQVEWIRDGLRYQMHLDVVVGLRFAPLLVRRLSSEGRLGARGLEPERYDEESRRAFAERRLATVRFDDDRIVLAHGRRVPKPDAVQDSASQFGQITWLLTREPGRLAPGGTIELDLALPRRVDRWVYEVGGPETLSAAFGAVEVFRLRPRHGAPVGTLSVEMWIAPALQYLPVRILIRQDAETFIDLTIDRPPRQAPAR